MAWPGRIPEVVTTTVAAQAKPDNDRVLSTIAGPDQIADVRGFTAGHRDADAEVRHAARSPAVVSTG